MIGTNGGYMSINFNEPKRILCIVGKWKQAALKLLMKIYRVLDHKKYQMDFYVASAAS